MLFDRKEQPTLKQLMEFDQQLGAGKTLLDFATFLNQLDLANDFQALMRVFYAKVRSGEMTRGEFQDFLERTLMIDCDAYPNIVGAAWRKMPHPNDIYYSFCLNENWKFVMHQKCGQIKWNPKNIQFYRALKQDGCGSIYGPDILPHCDAQGIKVLNVNVLYYLIMNPRLIQTRWVDCKAVHFWGTIFEHPDGYLVVPKLCKAGRDYYPGYSPVNKHFTSNEPALIIT